MIRFLKSIILRKLFKSIYKPGSFYSPIPDLKDVNNRKHQIYKLDAKDVLDIQLNELKQVNFLLNCKNLYEEFNFPANASDEYQYYYNNIYFNKTDALALFFIIRSFKPKKIIEVGSGFSSAMMSDINRIYFENQINLTFIEPYPKRLHSLIGNVKTGNVTVIEDFVQNISPNVFKELQRGDLLFIDSSHISKVGSDLNFLLFNIFPMLNAGVVIHFHDIFNSFEYPYDWIKKGICWNEAYLLRAFLMNNKDYEIILFNDFIHKCKNDELIQNMSEFISGGSIYIKKIN